MIHKKIYLSIIVLIINFLLLSTCTFAWFSSSKSINETINGITVVNINDYQLVDFNLYKFVFPTVELSDGKKVIDYLSPKNGNVEKLTYREDLDAFGLTINDSFEVKDANMNMYDPYYALINKSSLFSMDTNIIYEAKIKFTNENNIALKINAALNDILLKENQVLASSCLEFDVFFTSSLNSPSLDNKVYYPSYKSTDVELNEIENIYYKISYLASLDSQEHLNFFSTEENKITLYNDEIQPDSDGIATIYINVNYNMEKMTSYFDAIRFNNLDVIHDYYFLIGY